PTTGRTARPEVPRPSGTPRLRRHRRADGGLERRHGWPDAPRIPSAGPPGARPAAAQVPRADAQAEGPDRSGTAEARTGASRRAAEPARGQDHHLLGLDAV